MFGEKILIVEDDYQIGQMLQQLLAAEGADVSVADGGREALRRFYAYRPGLVLLDLMLPDMEGFEVCRQMRMMSDAPIIMLTALTSEDDILRGFAAGADDYVTKPFSPQVLLARMRAVLNRTDAGIVRVTDVDGYSDDYLSIDLKQRRVTVEGSPVHLSPLELNLLTALVERPNRVMTYEQLLERIWGWEYREETHYVHVYMSRLRHKLERDPKIPMYLRSQPQIGYLFQTHFQTHGS
jgi:two-component system KDP operon response regulator KdpE